MTRKKLKKVTPIIAALLLIGLALSSKLYLPNKNAIHLGKHTQASQQKSEPFRLVIDIKQATLTPNGINTYTLTFNADYMEKITAIAQPPNKHVTRLTVYEYRDLAHEGVINDFDHNPPTVFLHLNGKSLGAFTLYGYSTAGKHIMYKLRENEQAEEATPSNIKQTTGRATLFINHLCCL